MAGVLPVKERIKRRRRIKSLYLENYTVAEIAKKVDLTRAAVYEDLSRLQEAGEVPEGKSTTGLQKLTEEANNAIIEQGMTDVEIAYVNKVTIFKAQKMRKILKVPITSLVDIDKRRESFLKMYDDSYSEGKNFAKYFGDKMPEILVGYYIRGEKQSPDDRHMRGWHRRRFILGDTDTLIKAGAICLNL